ncbi:glycosyltransferase family 2 protein [candidate division KSB1 bacterium]|nr:glycosyltransferase family 2 protein [candidate division KSB1 bacterium]NIR72181.1 glycosyltransferase family 2 protein [candidate division KSB1 bacterium]NIS26646.1 glycosyltransferase family 2 protein [candidate division KSB1 bacterium]NIT73414.1 glycosyltransferase family 2 protein [candidate division KSB1 bacterium]NIU27262.1 glycosyltransferase family 2 protein [candidate division KSB1 bacterium]
MQDIEYSLVIPVLNEEENVEIVYSRVTAVLRQMGKPYEIIFVDDGSTDQTYSILRRFNLQDACLKVVKFRRNFGQSAAMAAGFEQARGQFVISMDGDLQNDPRDIPKLLEKIEEGNDIVAGWRKNRKDKLLIRKVPSMVANRIIRFLTGVHLHDTGCSLKAYRSEVIKNVRLYGELHRFIPVLARIEGARISEMVVSHHARRYGQSKYNLTRTFKVIMDLTTLNLLMKYLSNPVHFFGMLGCLFNLSAIIALGGCAYLFVTGESEFAGLNVLGSVAFLLLTSGCQFIFYGLIANMVVKTGEKHDPKLVEYYGKS